MIRREECPSSKEGIKRSDGEREERQGWHSQPQRVPSFKALRKSNKDFKDIDEVVKGLHIQKRVWESKK